MPSREAGAFFMAYLRGEAREQTTMFPVTLDELIPADHICRVIEAFVDRLDVAKLGFVRAEPRKASCSMCLRIAVSTIRATAHSSTAASSHYDESTDTYRCPGH